MRVDQCSGMPADARPATTVAAAGEHQRRASGTFTVMEPVPSDTDCVARSLSRRMRSSDLRAPLSLSPGISIDVPDVISLTKLAAETFVLAFERREQAPCRGSVLPWLYGIATNVLRRSWRAERRRLLAYGRSVDQWAVSEDEGLRDSTVPLSTLGWHVLSRRCARRMRLLLLYALADLSYEEIAFALDVPVGTVRTWLHRARRTARRVLAAETEAPSRDKKELISMAELDRFPDFRSSRGSVKMPGGEPRLQGAIEGKHRHGRGTVLLVRRRRTDCACPRRARHRSRHRALRQHLLEDLAWFPRASASSTAQHPPARSCTCGGSRDSARLIPPAITRGPGSELPWALPGAVESPRRGGRSRGLPLDCTRSARPGSTKRRRTGSA